MNTPVNVLEVLRYNAKEATKKWGADNQDAEALAAVAALIEAADGMQKSHGRVAFLAGTGAPMNVDYWEEADLRLRQLRESLARVRGDA